MKVFKIEYRWYEDDHHETLLAKDVNRKMFENHLTEACYFAYGLKGRDPILIGQEYLGKGYSVECLPEFYEQVIWYLINRLGYTEVEYDDRYTYEVYDGNGEDVIPLKREKTTVEVWLNDNKHKRSKVSGFGVDNQNVS